MILPEDITQRVVLLDNEGKNRELAVIVNDNYFDLAGLSAYSGFSVSTLRSYIKKRGLPCFRVDGKIMVKRSEYDRWFDGFRKNQGADLETIANEAVASVRA
jgi:hypothetical protein